MCSWMSYRKSSLHAIDFTGGWVAYKCYHWSSFFKWLWFIPYSFSNSYEIARLLQNSLRELWFCCVEDFREGLIKIQLIRVLPKQWIKHWLEFSVFPPLTSAHWLEKKNQVATNSINDHKCKLCKSQNVLVWMQSLNKKDKNISKVNCR